MDALVFAAPSCDCPEALWPQEMGSQPLLDELLRLLPLSTQLAEFPACCSPPLRISLGKNSRWLVLSFLSQCTGNVTERSGWHLAKSRSLEGLYYFGPLSPVELATPEQWGGR